MTSPVSAIEAIEKAMEGVTPGRWGQYHPSYAPEAEGAPFSTWDSSHDVSAMEDGKHIKRIATFKHATDAAYLDACSPDRMREVLALARQAEALQRENAEKDARIAALEAGIRPFSKYAGVVFERNFNSSDPVDTMTATDGAVSTLYARDFFSARALLGGSENAGN